MDVFSALSKFLSDYNERTPKKLKLVDVYLA
jgi:hypothetical protein